MPTPGNHRTLTFARHHRTAAVSAAHPTSRRCLPAEEDHPFPSPAKHAAVERRVYAKHLGAVHTPPVHV